MLSGHEPLLAFERLKALLFICSSLFRAEGVWWESANKRFLQNSSYRQEFEKLIILPSLLLCDSTLDPCELQSLGRLCYMDLNQSR